MHLLAAIVALVGVNVVPMDSERVLPGQTVIVEDARVGDDRAAEPPSIEEDRLLSAGLQAAPMAE